MDIVNEVIASLVPEALRAFLARREEEGRRILLEELRVADIELETAAQSDAFIGMLYRWTEAWRQGAAFRNLRLLAQVMCSRSAYTPHGSDRFLMWAEAISSLTPDEIVFLAAIEQAQLSAGGGAGDDPDTLSRMLHALKESLLRWPWVAPTEAHFRMLCASTLRTGFVVPVQTWDDFVALSPMGEELVRMTKLHDAADDVIRSRTA